MINFTDKQWDRVIQNYRLWENGKLHRPVLPCVLWGADPGRKCPDNPLLSFSNCNDFSITPEQIIDRYDYELSSYEYYGESYPLMQMMQFGPGLAAAFLGCELHNDANTVWFHPKEVKELKDLHFCYDADNIWLRRVLDIYKAGADFWRGSVVMGMVDLGGMLDILASFRSTDNLLMDLYDEPDEIKRLIGELQSCWLRFYDEINAAMGNVRGYSDWSGIFYEKPSYMMQSDFSFMISNDMFKEFVIGELDSTAKHMSGGAWYHLDGVGQLNHLGTLLENPNIRGIQWVPGEGEPKARDWSDVYKKISDAGKKIQAYYDLDSYLEEILAVINKPDLLVKMQFGYPITQKETVLKRLSSYGVEIK